jgi:outer membrane protein assembly factor BamB
VKSALRGIAVIAAGLAGCCQAAADPITFGYGNARLGSYSAPIGITATNVQKLRASWHTSVGGAINTQPLVVDAVRAGNRLRNLVLVGTEHGQVVALDANTGAIVWRQQVGTATRRMPNCEASPDSRLGVTATLAVDRAASRVYAVDVNGLAWALALGSGHPVSGWPVRVHPPGDEFVWGALTLSRGWLYVALASRCDAGHYDGGITAVDVGHPATLRSWHTTGGTGGWGGGIWGFGGVSVDDRNGDVYAATGNSAGTKAEDVGFAESVVRLSSALVVKQADHPLRGPFRVADRDFGTTPVLLDARGCPPELVAINKDGELFLYDRNRIDAGPVQRIRVADDKPGTVPLLGMPAFDPVTRTVVVASPTTPSHSALRAGLQGFALTRACTLTLRWQHVFYGRYLGSPPVIAGGLVFLGSGRGRGLDVFRLSDGRGLWDGHVFRDALYAPPALDRGTVIAGDWSGDVTAFEISP